MWEGIAPIENGYEPPICESPAAAKIVVYNAGPGSIIIKGWLVPRPEEEIPDIKMELRPGHTRTLWASLVRVGLRGTSEDQFAAVGWRSDGLLLCRP